MAIKLEDKVQNLINLTPWRLHQPVTADKVRLGLMKVLGPVQSHYKK